MNRKKKIIDTIDRIVNPTAHYAKVRVFTSDKAQMLQPVLYKEIISPLYETDLDMCFPDQAQADFWITNYSGSNEK